MSEYPHLEALEAAQSRDYTERPGMDRLTGMLLEQLREHNASEPEQDAGSHPSMELHEEIGQRWREWAERKRAYETLLAPRLIREALERLA